MTTWHNTTSSVEPVAPAKYAPRSLFLEFVYIFEILTFDPRSRQPSIHLLGPLKSGKCKNFDVTLFGVVVTVLRFHEFDSSVTGSRRGSREFFSC